MHDAGVQRQQLAAATRQACETLEGRRLLSASSIAVMHYGLAGQSGSEVNVSLSLARGRIDPLSVAAWSGKLGPLPATLFVVGKVSDNSGLLPSSGIFSQGSHTPTPLLNKPAWHPLAGESAVRPGAVGSWLSFAGLLNSASSTHPAFTDLSHQQTQADDKSGTKQLAGSDHESDSESNQVATDDQSKSDGGFDQHQFGGFGHGVISLAELTKCGSVRIVQTIDADLGYAGGGAFGLFGITAAATLPAGTRMPASDGVPQPPLAAFDQSVVLVDGNDYKLIAVLNGSLQDLGGPRGDGSGAVRPADIIVRGDGAVPSDAGAVRSIRFAHRGDTLQPATIGLSPNLPNQGASGVTPLGRPADASAARRSSNSSLADVENRESAAVARPNSNNSNIVDPQAVRGGRTLLADSTPPELSGPSRAGTTVARAVVRLMSSSAGIQLFNTGTKVLDMLRLPHLADPAAAGGEIVDPQAQVDNTWVQGMTLGLAPWHVGKVKDETVDAVWRTIASVSLALAVGGYWYCSTVAARRAELERLTVKAKSRLKRTPLFSEDPVRSSASFPLIGRLNSRE